MTSKITTEKEKRPPSWTAKLVMLVGQVIRDQRDGCDALASASWDAVVEHWTECER